MATGISPKHLLEYVIRPTLKHIGLYSEDAEILLIDTLAQESMLGHYLKQLKGPALGPYQIEPPTHKDVYDNFLIFNKNYLLRQRVASLSRFEHSENRECELITNLEYSTAIARLIYYRAPEKLPSKDDVEGRARYWKKYYNTPKGKGTEEEFISSHERLVRGRI